jgi:hypothetical protein
LWFGKGRDPAGRFGTTSVTAPRNCSPACEPFWGHGGKKAQELGDPLRQTDKDVGGQPKSVFPVGGAGAVGTSSLRGTRYPRDLSEAGFAPIALSAPSNRRSLVALGAETTRLAARQRLPLWISTPTAIEGPAHAAPLPSTAIMPLGLDRPGLALDHRVGLARNRSGGAASVRCHSSSKARNRAWRAC